MSKLYTSSPYLHPILPLTPAAYVQVMFVMFAVATALWATIVVRAGQTAHRVHHLMTALAAAKTATLLSEAGMYHFVRATGTPDGWNIAFYIFTFLRGLLFFSVRMCPCCVPAILLLSSDCMTHRGLLQPLL